jgi:nucleoside-diphosphate-sugar epimerase
MTKIKNIIILGGLGFIGKNLYHKLIKENHTVTLLADKVYEINDGFLTPETRAKVVVGSTLDKEFIELAIVGYDVVFSLAGSSGAADSIANPYHDLDTNLKGHLNVLEACRKNNPNTLLIFPSSRLVYGKPLSNPVSESHLLRPESIYAIHKLATENYYQLYHQLYGLNSIIFRISNPFGPYQRFGSNNYGVLNWFIHKALTNESIDLYGDGQQQRDFLYIDDLTDLFAQAIHETKLFGNIYNVGYGTGISLKEAVDVIRQNIPATKTNFKPWPEIARKIETGNYISDISLLKAVIGWEPKISFENGIKATLDFYGKHST